MMRLQLAIQVVSAAFLARVTTSFMVSFGVNQQYALPRNVACFVSRGNNSGRSRIEGNQREPSQEELNAMDEMITKLANAKPYELPNAVQRAFRVVSSPKFFLRIAELADNAKQDIEKKKLAALASNLISTLEAVVSTTEDKLDETSKDVEKVVKAAAEPDSGEFLVPLLPERIQSMREEFYNLDDNQLNERFLSTVDSWMNKSYKDGMDLMVGILQKVLQMYAGRKIAQVLSREADISRPSRKLLVELLNADADMWDGLIRGGIQNGITAEQLQSEVQSSMETIVFSLEAGSLSQRVQAEYLKEISKRVELIIQ
jgi:hypothetical protein